MLATAQQSPTPSICIWWLDDKVKLLAKINRGTDQLAWSPDETVLAFEDNGVQLWNLATKEVLPNFGMIGAMSDRPWSTDGRYLASFDRDSGAVNIWDIAEKTLHASIGSTYLGSPVFARQGTYFAVMETPPDKEGSTRNQPRSIHIWDLARNQRVKNIPLGRDFVNSIAWSPDGSRIAVLQSNKTTLWDVKTGEPLPISQFGDADLETGGTNRFGEWSPDGKRLLAIRGGRPALWDANADTWQTFGRSQVDPYLAVTDEQGGMFVKRDVYATRSSTSADVLPIDAWDLENIKHILGLKTNYDGVAGFALSPMGRHLAVYTGPREVVGRRVVSPQGDLILEGPLDLTMYDMASGNRMYEKRFEASPSLGVEWSPDGDTLLLKSMQDGRQCRLLTVTAASGEVGHILEGRIPPISRAQSFGGQSSWPTLVSNSLAWSPDSKRVAWQVERNVVTVLQLETGEVERQLQYIPSEIRERESERELALQQQQQAIRKRLEERRAAGEDVTELLRRTFAAGRGGRGGRGGPSSDTSVDYITWSSDGRWLAARRSSDGSRRGSPGTEIEVPDGILVWDMSLPGEEPTVEFSMEVANTPGPKAPIAMFFSPNNSRLMLRDAEWLRCWDIESGELLTDTVVAGLESNSSNKVLGWLPDGNHFALLLDPGRDEPLPSLALQEIGGQLRSTQIAVYDIYGEPASAHVVGDKIHVFDARANALLVYNSALEHESTYVLNSDGKQGGVLQVDVDGQVHGEAGDPAPFAVILTEDGQRTLSLDEFNPNVA